MSGSAGGLILLPLAMANLPLVLGGLAVFGVARAAANAMASSSRYERERRTNAAPIRTSTASYNVGNFRNTMYNNMAEQKRYNVQASNVMMSELEVQREQMKKAAENNDPQQYQEYVNTLKLAHTSTMQNIYKVQNDFNTQYQNKISESMKSISAEINEKYSGYMDELKSLQNDISAKNEKAMELAKSYIEEAKTLIASLADDFNAGKYAPRQLANLQEQFNQVVAQYNSGRYETAIAAAKDVTVNTLEEIYETDAKKQEWENYFKLSLVLSEEVKNYIESQAVITQEVKEYAEKNSGKKLEDEIVGISVADYTAKNSSGQNKYDYIKSKADEIYNALRAPEAENLSTQQLKSYVDFLNNELYPSAADCISKGIINMNNAFSRQNISEEIIDFFEEHNFTFNGYAYDDDCHDKALHIGLENESTGEELILSLSPEVLSNGDIQTKVDLKQTKGEAENEERKAYYRQCVEDVVKGSNPYAQVSIKCDKSTFNKLCDDKETKKKLKM